MSATELRQITVPTGSLRPNPWNPNRMTERVYQAEKESIEAYGFIDPVTVRPHPLHAGEYEIIDGEHRVRAATEMGYEELPVIVLDSLTDTQAKKLTIILNETRGEADVALLGRLVAEIRQDVELADLKLGLPYSDTELQHLTEIGSFDWDEFQPNSSPQGSEPDVFSAVLTFGSRKDLERFQTFATLIDHERQAGGQTAAVLVALQETVERIETASPE
jgi:hypothetical protein